MSNIHRITLSVGVLKEDVPVSFEGFINAEPDYSVDVQFGDQVYAGISDIFYEGSSESGENNHVKITLSDGRQFLWDIRNGQSAYQLAVAAGFEGTIDKWLASLIGRKGDPGNAATVSFERVVLIGEGEQPSVVNIGDENNAVFEMYLPVFKGDKGDVGDGLHFDEVYSSYDRFISDHPYGDTDEVYLVEGNIIVWSKYLSTWVNGGPVRGPKGDPLKFEDLTPEQKRELKGEKGDTGDTLQFDDLTPEQKELLKGPQGETIIIGGEQQYKLYNSTGNNTDGAISQKALTDILNRLRAVATQDEYDAMRAAGTDVKGTAYLIVEEEDE